MFDWGSSLHRRGRSFYTPSLRFFRKLLSRRTDIGLPVIAEMRAKTRS
jgi:hypothetical protein